MSMILRPLNWLAKVVERCMVAISVGIVYIDWLDEDSPKCIVSWLLLPLNLLMVILLGSLLLISWPFEAWLDYRRKHARDLNTHNREFEGELTEMLAREIDAGIDAEIDAEILMGRGDIVDIWRLRNRPVATGTPTNWRKEGF